MSFVQDKANSTVYAPGWFLAHEECVRKTKTIPASMGTTVGSTKYVKMGTVFPSNDANAIGIVYEDVDVTTGDMPGSVVTKGEVIEGRLPVAIASAAKTALAGKGFTFVTEPTVTRPNFES